MPQSHDSEVITILVPAKHLVDGAGAATVFRLQVMAVRAAGLFPSLVVIAPGLLPRQRFRSGQITAIRAFSSAMDVEISAIVGNDWRPKAWPALVRTAVRVCRKTPYGPEEDLDLDRLTAKPSKEVDRPAAVLCNYVSGLHIADALAPRLRQLIILHDLPDRPPSDRFRRALANRPHLMSLNGLEAHRLAGLAPEAAVHLGVPFPHLADARHRQGANRRPPHAATDLSAETSTVSGPGKPATADLLFVGGLHGPNVEGITRFLQDCFIPHLATAGVTLAIAGRACQALTRFQDAPGLVLCGPVDDLGPLYRAATLVVVPLLTGTGISLKTLEALAQDKPVLSTPAGLRGLGMTEAVGLTPPFDGRWASAVIELIRNGDARASLRDRLKAELRGPTLEESLGHILPALVEGRTVPPLPRRPLFPH